MGGVYEFFSFDPVTIGGTICNTLIIFLFFKKFLFGRVNKILEERNADIAKSYADADTALRSAEEKERSYTEKLASAKEESAEIVKNATKKAQSRSDEIITEAKDEARQSLDKAKGDIERERRAAVNQIKDEISVLSVMIARKMVDKELDAKTHSELIDSYITELGDE
jgi:F-type H+-transporting ATPase subunit b